MNQVSTNLASVRDRLGTSQKELAVRLGVSASLISKWEKGERVPDESQLWEIGRVFGVSTSFLRSGRVEVGFQPRALSPRDSGEKDEIGKALVDAAEQLHFVTEIQDRAKLVPSSFGLALTWSDQQLGAQATMVRQYLRLNDRITYEELRTALAELEVLVFEWKLPPKLSGLSYNKDLTAIFINSVLPERVKLFTLCHELAHLLYHLREDAPSQVSVMATRNDPLEKQANRFATEFLMPQAAIDGMVQNAKEQLKTRMGFLAAANRFGVTPEALFYRLEKSGLMRWSDSERFFSRKPRPDKEDAGPRVSRISEQVPGKLLSAVLQLWEREEVSGGKLAQWLFASRDDLDTWLASLDEDVALGLAETDCVEV